MRPARHHPPRPPQQQVLEPVPQQKAFRAGTTAENPRTRTAATHLRTVVAASKNPIAAAIVAAVAVTAVAAATAATAGRGAAASLAAAAD